MSITMGLIGEGFSVVAGDTRTVDIFNGNTRDDANKIFRTKFGWVVEGGGVLTSGTIFNNLLHNLNIKTRKHIYTCWLMAIKETLRLAEYTDAELYTEVNQEVNSSQAIISINYFQDSVPVIEINTIDFAYGRRKMKAYNSLIVNPPKKTIRTKRLITKYSDLAKDITNVYEAIYTMACFLDELSRISKWISNILDCGISLKISNDEILFLKLREGVKTIKKLYKEKQDLSEIMYVAGGLKDVEI
jgi:hypothetical protein